jgi:aryl-alcohol dehydrogenase-like predicted oxidoreductase
VTGTRGAGQPRATAAGGPSCCLRSAPAEACYQTYWTRLRALDHPFLRGTRDAAVATALRFTLAAPGVHAAIVGTTRPERWPRNAALLDAGVLPAAEFKQIRARWNEVARPSWAGQV